MVLNITIFTDASFCHTSKAAGGAFWARGGEIKASNAFAIKGAMQSHDAEVMASCRAILQIAEHPELGKELAKGSKTRVVLVVDCATVEQAIAQGKPIRLSPTAQSLVRTVRALHRKLDFQLKINHVKAHSGTGTPRQWVNQWCDQNSRTQMRRLRDTDKAPFEESCA